MLAKREPGMQCLNVQKASTHQLREEIADSSIGDVGCEGVKAKGPGQGVRESFSQLIPLEMFVSNALLIDSHSLHCEDAVTRLQPPCVELVVRNDKEEDDSQSGRQAAVDEEDDFPGSDGCTTLSGTHCDAVCNQTAEDLTESVEGEPDTGSCALFFLGPPLRCDESETGCYGSLKDTQKD